MWEVSREIQRLVGRLFEVIQVRDDQGCEQGVSSGHGSPQEGHSLREDTTLQGLERGVWGLLREVSLKR